MNVYVILCWLACFVGVSEAQESLGGGDRGLLFNRRPILGGGGSWGSGGSPCGSVDEDYDLVDSDQRSLLAVAGGAVLGGVVGGAAGYHLGMKHQKPIVINNNVINHLPSPCYSIPVQVTTGGGGSGGWGGGSGGGIIGGLLSNHPILSSILQGGILGGGGGGGANRVTNRNIRQFSRRVVRPITRVFK